MQLGTDDIAMIISNNSVKFVSHAAKLVRLTMCLFIFTQLAGVESFCRADADVKRISTTELKKFLDERTDVLLINVLPPIIYDSMHLPGSINYPIGKIERQQQLPFPQDKPIIFYCMGTL